MIITPIKTPLVQAGAMTLAELIDSSVPDIQNGSILVITSKVVSLCENRVEDITEPKEELIRQEASRYTGALGKHGFHFTVTKGTLIPSAGIDESNSNNLYVLWPEDPQKSANDIREYLMKRHSLTQFGVVITDSTCTPLRRGTSGIAIAHSGFKGLKDYIGKPDLFGRPFKFSQANIMSPIAAATVVTMGEGTEQTPLCMVSDLDFVEFQDRNPSAEELAELYIEPEEDVFAPMLESIDWQVGQGK